MDTIYGKNFLEEEILITKDPIRMIAGSMIEEGGVDRLEKAIRNTYAKPEATKIIEALNILLAMGGLR